jgi:hypothetical protein
VWSYQEKADFQKENLPSGFPYFGAVRQYWGNYCCIARLTHRKYRFNAGEQIMLGVIGTSFSAEYILKGIYEETVGRLTEWTSGHQFTEEDSYAYQVARDYADFVHLRPFYEFRFARHVKGLWTDNPFFGRHFLRKWERRAFLTIDYSIEALYCWVIEKATHISYGFEPDLTYVWLDNVDSSLLSRVEQIRDPKQVGPRAFVVAAPRYQPFTGIAIALAEHGAHFVEIAGNSDITISILVNQSWNGEMRSAERLFSMPILTRSGQQRLVLRSNVNALDGVLKELSADNVTIEHVYDY